MFTRKDVAVETLSSLRKGGLVRLTVVALIAIALLGGIVYSKHASSQRTSPSSHITLTFGAQHRNWVISHSMLPNTTYHWNETSYLGPATSQDDPGIGKVVSEDHWLITDGKGIPNFQHSVFTLPDGILYQETYDDSQESIIVRGPGYKDVLGSADSSSWCISKGGAQSLAGVSIPLYIDVNNLGGDGFKHATRQTSEHPVPTLANNTTEVNGTPSTSFEVPSIFDTWDATGSAPVAPLQEKVHFDVDSKGRIVTFSVNKFDPTNDPQDQHGSYQWYAVSSVYAYPSTAVIPNWVKSEPPQVKKGC
jgi:hypothetical protein